MNSSRTQRTRRAIASDARRYSLQQGALEAPCVRRFRVEDDPRGSASGSVARAPGDTISLGPARGTLHVVKVRPVSGPLDEPILVVKREAG
jgi:hypothetical protein